MNNKKPTVFDIGFALLVLGAVIIIGLVGAYGELAL